MHLHSETAAPMGSIIGNGGSVVTKAVTAKYYQPSDANAKDFAASFVAAKFGLSFCLARVVCELAHLGGRLS